MWSVINVSINLHTTYTKLTGLSFSGLFLDPFLNSGVIFVSFHSEGTIPSSSDKITNCASDVLICSTISISSFGGIPSTPGDLLSFIFLIFFAIISGVTNNCPKYSDLFPANLVNGSGSELISSVVKTELSLLSIFLYLYNYLCGSFSYTFIFIFTF